MSANYDLIGHGDPVTIRETGAVGTVEAVDNNPYVKQYRIAGQWYPPSKIRRCDDPHQPPPRRAEP